MLNDKFQDNLLKIIDDIYKIENLKNIDGFNETIALFKKRLKEDEFRIAVVGEFSSGKSTFINALIGKDILKHGATETTAVITKIKNIKAKDESSCKGKVIFSSGKVQKLDNIYALNDFTTTNSKKYNVVNDIKTVELYVHIAENAKNITIIDTPGLNGMADGHRERTIEIIKAAHACIYILPARGISETDISFLKYLVHYQKNFIFIQNFIDKLRSAENETIEDKIEALKEVLSKKIFSNVQMNNIYICGVSALYELAAKDLAFRFASNSGSEVTREERLLYEKKSHFDRFRTILKEGFSDEKLQHIQFEGTAWAIYEWCNELLESIETNLKQISSIYELSSEKKQREQLQALKEKINKNFKKQNMQLADLVTAKVADISKETRCGLSEKLAVLYDEIIEYINSNLNDSIQASNVESVVATVTKEINDKLLNVNIIVDQQLESCGLQFQALYHVLKRRIEVYTGINQDNDDDIIIKIKNNNSLKVNISDDKIIEKEKQKEDAKKELLEIKIEIAENMNKIENNIKSIDNYKTNIENAEKRKQADLSRLGSRPNAVEKKEDYTVYRDRTGIGSSIIQFFFGKKEETRSRIVYDDSAGKAWDKEKKSIERTYNDNIFNYNSKIKELNALKMFASNKISAAKMRLADIEGDIRTLEDDIKQEKLIKKSKIKLLKEKYIEDCKNNFKEQLKNHLLEDGETYTEISADLEKDIKVVREELIAKVQAEYEKNIEERLKMIDKMGSGQESELLQELNLLKDSYDKLKDIAERLRWTLNE